MINSFTIWALVIWLVYIVTLLLVPPILLGVIGKVKARLQNRIGASIFQPVYDLDKLLNKGETVSQVTSWVFRSSACLNAVVVILIALMAPCLSYKPETYGGDLFLLIYLFALSRFMTVLSALDAGSAFGGFGSSREVTLAFLVEPAIILCMAALAVVSHNSDLGYVFSLTNSALSMHPILWVMAGLTLFLSSLVELSRMPVDDPTTHLELTMVHEAMILENSGRNLALVKYSQQLKMFVLLSLTGQCFLHAFPFYWHSGELTAGLASLTIVFVLGMVLAVLEATTVKLRWTRIPEFIAYPVAMSLLCLLMAIGKS